MVLRKEVMSTSAERAQKQKEKDPEEFKRKAREAMRRFRKNNPQAAKAAVDKWRQAHPEESWRGKLKTRALSKGIPFDDDTSDIIVPETCPILGIPLFWNTKEVGVPNNPSLDKIIPNLGYIKGNRHVVSNRANVLKRDATLEELVLLGEWAKSQLERGQ